MADSQRLQRPTAPRFRVGWSALGRPRVRAGLIALLVVGTLVLGLGLLVRSVTGSGQAPGSSEAVRLPAFGGGASSESRGPAGEMPGAAETQLVVRNVASPARFTAGSEPEARPLSPTVLTARLGLEPGSALPPLFTYAIQGGDTLETIAQRFGITRETILLNNAELGDQNPLDVGASLTLPSVDGVIYSVRLGDTLSAIADRHAVAVDDILGYAGNNLSGPDQLVAGATILLVGGSAAMTGGLDPGAVFAIPDFRWPMRGVLITVFGAPRGNPGGFHTVIDLSAAVDTAVAAAPGIAIQAGWDGSYGLSVLVDHGGGVVTRYAHLSRIAVSLGDRVEAGDRVGFVGNTGFSTGPHLHFAIIMGGIPVNPLVWLAS